MVELVVVMVIIGVLGTIGMQRFFDRGSYDVDQFADQARTLMRYAQKVAVAQNRPVFVRLDGASIALCFTVACTAADRVLAPSGSNSARSTTLSACDGSDTWMCEAPPQGITYTAAQGSPPASVLGPGAYYFYFDALGQPYRQGDPMDSEVASTFTSALVVTASGGGSTNAITVEAYTGYAY